MMERPPPIRPADEPPDFEVDWAELADDWRDWPVKVRRAGETSGEYANRVRAHVAEGLAHPVNLRFADSLEAA
jgi:hypothetical protein